MSQPLPHCRAEKCKNVRTSYVCSFWEEGRDQTSTFTHRQRCSSTLNLAIGLYVNLMFRSGHCLGVGQGCGWAEFKNALSHKIYPVFLPPIPWLAAVSDIRKLPIRGFLYLLLHWPKDSCYTWEDHCQKLTKCNTQT